MNYIVQQGDTLESIAAKELGDASLWQYLASINSIVYPYTVTPGQTISTSQVGATAERYKFWIVAGISVAALTATYFGIKYFIKR